MLDIAVCIKQVPGTDTIRVDPKGGTLVRTEGESIINPDDLHALETALSLRERYGGTITALSMGPPKAEELLREAYSLGADRCVLVSDPRFAGSDALVTSKILYRAIHLLGEFSIVVTGVESLDGNTSSVPFQLSELLGMPLVTQIHRLELAGGSLHVERLYGHEYQKIQIDPPVLLAVNRETNVVRFPSLADIKTCFERAVEVLTMDHIGGSEDEFGIKGSPTRVLESEVFAHRRKREVIEGDTAEKIDALVAKLKKHDVIRF